MNPKTILRFFLATLSFASLFVSNVHAATLYWDGGDGTWSTIGKWSTISSASTPDPGAAASTTDDAIFNITAFNGAEIISLDGNQSIQSLTFNNTGSTTIQSDSASSRSLTIGTGGITINASAGAVTIGNLSNPVAITLGAAQTWANYSGNTFNIINAVTKGTNLLTVGGSGDTVISGIISGSNGLTKNGTGNLTLQSNNSYTGATLLSGGGGLIFDYSAGDSSKLADTSTLTFNRGTITLKGDNVAHTEIVASTSLGAGGSFITRSGTNNTAKIQFGAITRASVGGTISFQDDSIATTTTANYNNILGGWAIIGNNWATNDGSGNIVAYSGYITTVPTSGTAAVTGTNNYQLSGSLTLAGALNFNSLKITPTANSQSISIGSNNLNTTTASATQTGGILYDGGVNEYSFTISGAGRVSANTASKEMIFAVTRGTLIIDAIVGSAAGANDVTKFGAGTLVLNKASTYTNPVRVNEGVLRLADAAATGSTAGGVFVQPGAALELSGGITVGAEALTIWGSGISNGGALRNVSGNNTWTGAIGTNGSGSTRINSDSGTLLTLTGGITTALNNHFTFGGAGDTTVSTTKITGAGNLTKDGNGTLTLSTTNDYTGTTLVSAGKLVVNGNISTSILTTVGSGATLGGAGTVGALVVGAGAYVTPGNSAGILTVNGNYSQAGQYIAEMNGVVAGTDYDQIAVTGAIDITGGSLVTMFSGSGYTSGSLLFILTNDSTDAVTGTFTGYAQGDVVANYGGYNWQISYTADTIGNTFIGGNDIALMAVPEPSIVSLISGVGILALLRRRRDSDFPVTP